MKICSLTVCLAAMVFPSSAFSNTEESEWVYVSCMMEHLDQVRAEMGSSAPPIKSKAGYAVLLKDAAKFCLDERMTYTMESANGVSQAELDKIDIDMVARAIENNIIEKVANSLGD